MNSIQQPTLTIVSVTGSQSYAMGSLYAVERSYHELKNQIEHLNCLLVSPEKPDNLPSFIKHVKCENFSYLEYNIFMIYSLASLIETDYALVVQNDGWVVDGSKWRNEFFDYDYIGAPVPFLVETKDNQYVMSYDREFWLQHSDNIPNSMYEPQNGGFSLRSRKLLNAPRELDLKLTIRAPDCKQNLPFLRWQIQEHHEDTFISTIKRSILEQYGCCFAPREIAMQFSFEHGLVLAKYPMDLTEVMGAHFGGDVVLIGVNDIQVKLKMYSDVNGYLNSPLFKKFLSLGYNLQIPA